MAPTRTTLPIVLLVLAHLAAAWTVVFRFRWDGLALALVLHFLIGCLGISIAYHRVLSHRSARLPRSLEYFFAFLGSLALHGDPVRWATIHRQHHRFADTEDDAHTPLRGFLHAHALWTRDRFLPMSSPEKIARYAPDLARQSFYQLTRDKLGLRIALQVVPLYLLGGTDWVLWGFLVRYVLTSTAVWSVNSITHDWGFRSYQRNDLSTNHVWVALASFGEGWHNNHHAFPSSARLGLRQWQLDLAWWTLRLLERLGLARDLKHPGADEVASGGSPRSWGELLGVRRPRMDGFRSSAVAG
jgi:stearoyl-CoA desaturase (delta-9 desaturase)